MRSWLLHSRINDVVPRDGNLGSGFGSPTGFTPNGCGFRFTFSPAGLLKPDLGIFLCGFRF
jgi:hypothetical protein